MVPETKKWPKLISRLEKENIENFNNRMVNSDNFSFSIDNLYHYTAKKDKALDGCFFATQNF